MVDLGGGLAVVSKNGSRFHVPCRKDANYPLFKNRYIVKMDGRWLSVISSKKTVVF